MCRVDGEMAKSSDSSVPKITSECTIVNTTGAVEAIRVMETKIRQIEQKFEAIINTVQYVNNIQIAS